MISLTLIDAKGQEIPVAASVDQPIELIIPRDPNVILSPFTLQNVSSIARHNQTWNFHVLNISRMNNLTVSLHVELHPLNQSIGYWFIYRFDGQPQLNSTIQLIDGWSLLCPSSNSTLSSSSSHQSNFSSCLDLTRDDLYQYFMSNQQVSNHPFVVIGLRELNTTEQIQYCINQSHVNDFSLLFDTHMNFSSDYEIRSYTSGCYYLDNANQWRSDGLIVRIHMISLKHSIRVLF